MNIRLLLPILALAATGLWAQSTETTNELPKSKASVTAAQPTTFNLDFPGGTPGQLVAAIQKATGRPLNTIIPSEYAEWQLPPLKMNHVDVAQLFGALEAAGISTQVVASGSGAFQQRAIGAGFHAKPGRPDESVDDRIWYFTVVGNSTPPKQTRFYLLSPYLEAGLSVDDITTAIQTAWRMHGDNPTPALSFHKETKLLIAVGDFASLDTIDNALRALDPVLAKTAASANKPAEKKP
jgi:hypothetical protein